MPNYALSVVVRGILMTSFAKQLGRRMAEQRKMLGMTQQQVADLVGLSFQQISSYERGHRRPPRDRIPKLAEVLHMSVEEFFDPEDLPDDAYPATDEMVSIPVIAQVNAGLPRMAEESYEEMEPVAAHLVRGGEYFWLRVEGDSMVGIGIRPGALVLVRRQPEVKDGEIAVVDVEGEGATIKRVFRSNGELILVAENPAYPPMKVPASKARIIGKATMYQVRL